MFKFTCGMLLPDASLDLPNDAGLIQGGGEEKT